MKTNSLKIFISGMIIICMVSCQNSQKTPLQQWQDMKFGMFVHWGPVSLKGTEIGWSRGKQISFEEYDNLYKRFNPELFDARDWVSIAKSAGMNYFVITSKHHDGFSIFHSDFTDYDMLATPYKKDVLKELSDECKKQDVLFGTYYSILDWYHPDYPLKMNRSIPKENSDMKKYIQFMKSQLDELINKYNTNILWFDGEWEDPWTHEDGQDLYSFVKGLNADILINNRVDKGRKGMQGMTKSSEFAGDFGTPEQEIGAFNLETPWESCITICRQWAWKPDDELKSLKECIQTLVTTCGGGGNLLLNVGPMPDGRIEPRQVEVLAKIGEWLKENGESIYGTNGGPFISSENFASTNHKKKIYLHFMNGITEIDLPDIGFTIKKAFLLNGNKAEFIQKNGSINIRIPDNQSNQIDQVVVLKIK